MRKKAVLISCFDWYSNRLVYIEKYLEEKGYDVFIFLSDFNHKEKKRNYKYGDNEAVTYIKVPKYAKNISLKRLYSHYFFSKQIKKEVKKIEPNIVYALVPPNSIIRELSVLKEDMKYKLLYDVIDLWPESFPKNHESFFPFIYWKKLRNTYINRADKVVLECDFYKEELRNVIDIEKIHLLYLIKSKSYDYELPNKENDSYIRLGYLGSINSLIDIDKICQVIRMIQNIKPVCVEIIGDGESKKEFIDSLEQIGVEVHYHGIVYDDEKKNKILGMCHFGINIYKSTLKIGLTMKSIDYFMMGLPILNSIQGDTHKIVKNYNTGINLDELNVALLQEYLRNNNQYSKNALYVFDKYFNSINVQKHLMFLDSLTK